jgi:LCP family protein required for cell wall assembly
VPRWRSRTFKGLIVFVSACVVLTATAYVYLRVQLDKIKRVDIPGLNGDASGHVMNVLLVGSDSRANVTGDLADATGKAEEGSRQGLSDTIMILHIDPKDRQASILSIPRDLYVPIAGSNSKGKINSAFAEGGAATLIKTIQDSLGIDVNHYVEVDFEGFQHMVDTVGGLKIYLDAPARDTNSGLDLPDAGCVQLDGYQALAYVRSRYYETYEAGRWVTDPTSDFGRIKRQQDFIRRMMKKAVSQGLTNPLTLNRLINIGVNNVTLDSAMSTKDIVTVARRFRSLDPDTVDMQTLPTTGASYTYAGDVQLINEDEAQPLIDRMNGKAPPGPVRPSDVQVRVLNGNGGDGAASKAAFALRNIGFAVSGSGDADSFSYRQSVIRYGAGKEDKAQLLKAYLSAGASLEEDHTLGTVDLALVVGADYTGVRPSPAGPDVSPATTSAPQTPQPDAKGAGAKQPAC